ncbi:MAG: endonuclease MutS2 [Candidatus Binatia bacterium]
MRTRDLEVLEFDKVLRLLADSALSEAGREACLSLSPHTTEDVIIIQSERTWQFFRLLEEQLSIPLQAFPDIRPSLQWATHIGTALEGVKLLEILQVVALSRAMATFFRRHAATNAALHDLPSRLLAFPELEEVLQRCLNERGELKDEASPELRSARRRLRTLGEEIEQRLQRTLHSAHAKEVIADTYITIRNNRFVIPVRPNFQSRLPGIVQDRSGSGETLFVEPLFAVELNNRLLLFRKEMEAEEQRLFLWLTELVRNEIPALTETFATLIEVDVLYANAAFARTYRCSKPLLGGGTVRLRTARHPLLLATGTPVTPVDILIPEGKCGLIITGPNTGGKTAALKTLGLLCLMAQSGMLIPAQEESHLPLFSGIFADIGDAQSLEHSLSTFSAHVQNVADILNHLRSPALVLLDEPGGGTDPSEGGALACGLLLYLKERGVHVAASTHLAPVKLFALADGFYHVAAVAFDLETLTPHYQLSYNAVGQSLGLQMARRLGLPEEVCAAAEASLSSEERQLSHALVQLEEMRTALEREQAQVRHERTEVERQHAQQQAQLAEIEEKRRQVWHTTTTEARQMLRRIREEGREIVANLRAARPAARQQLAQFVHQRGQDIAAREQEVQTLPTATDAPPQIGDVVELREGRIRGELLALQGHRARIRTGGMTFEVPVEQIRKSREKQERAMHVRVDIGPAAMPELNLLGLRVHEALPRVEEFLDRAVLNHQTTVRIVHGMGTGALRRAVRTFLADSPYCTSYSEATRAEGGGGATIVELSS